MFNDILWGAKGNGEFCVHNSKTIIEYPERFPRGHWSFLGPRYEKKWYGTYVQSSLRQWYAWKLENGFIKEEAEDHVLRSKQIRNVDHQIYQVKKQDHLGKHKAKCEASRRPDATSWTTESQAYLSQRFRSEQKTTNSNHVFNTRNNFFKTWARRRSTGSVKHRKGCWKTWIEQKSSSSAKTLSSFSARLQILYRSWDHLLQMRTKSKVQSKPSTKPQL